MKPFAAVVPRVATSRMRVASWLLMLQVICWIGVIVAGLVNFPAGEFDTWTPAVLASVRGPWILFHLFVALALIVGNSGMALIARDLRETPVRLVALITFVCALGGIAVVVVFALLRFSVLPFSEPILGQVGAYQASNPLFTASGVLAFLATILTAVCLWWTQVARRTGLVIAVLAGILMLMLFVGFPPFALGLLWLPLGIALYQL